MEKFAVTLFALALALIAVPSGAVATTTLDNLQTAYNGESNAHARYLAFAAKADQEGCGEVASLFRAAAKAEKVHAAKHSEVIKKLGGTPTAKIETPVVGSTKENLEAAVNGESYERDHVSRIPQAGPLRREQRCRPDLQLCEKGRGRARQTVFGSSEQPPQARRVEGQGLLRVYGLWLHRHADGLATRPAAKRRPYSLQ